MADDDAGDWLSAAVEDAKENPPSAEAPPPETKGKDKEKKHKKKKDKDKEKDKDKADKGDKADKADKGDKADKADKGKTSKRAQEVKPEAEPEYLDPDKLLLFKHWIRPKFLPYKYIYDYRHSYYDDVIDYLNKRQCGQYRDIPVAQTWAERALRTYNSEINKIKLFRDVQEDTKLCTKIKLGCRFHLYHSKEYFNRRYSSIL